MALLRNAAKNRRFWLENYYRVNERAVEGWDEWPAAWVLPADQENEGGLAYVLRILRMGDVEVHRATRAFEADGARYPEGTYVVPMTQPYASFAQTLLEVQHYPDLREFPGGPPRRPYDVTAHTLPLLMDVEAIAVERQSSPVWRQSLSESRSRRQSSPSSCRRTSAAMTPPASRSTSRGRSP